MSKSQATMPVSPKWVVIGDTKYRTIYIVEMVLKQWNLGVGYSCTY
jgi:hypothetical protein